MSLRKFSFFLILFAVLGIRASAQVDTGSIVGTVTDSSGASVADAALTIKEESTGQEQSQRSSQRGGFGFSPLKIGVYTLTVEKAGFKTSVQRHIQITVQGHLEINPALQVGEVSQNVQVNSSSPILETQTSSIQQLIDQRAINDLPLNGRNATLLAQLSPGVTFAQNDSRGLQASGSFTANGARRTQNDYLLDGMDDTVVPTEVTPLIA